jgi:cytochrome P450
MCLGVHLATMQAKAFLYQFLRRYAVVPQSRRLTRFQPVPIPHPSNSLPIKLVRAAA